MVVQSSGRRARRERRDRGFTLVESMVAMGILAVIATAAAAMLIHALGVTAADRQRVRAASVSAQEVERVRGLMQSNPSGITADTTRTISAVSPTLFTITSDVADSGTSYHLVDSGEWSSADAFESLKLTVTATWQDMGGTKPVVNSSILSINGTGGNGSGGSSAGSVTVTPVTPDPIVTISPTCSLSRGTALVTVNSTANVPAGYATVPWTSTFAGTVTASPASGNPCTSTIPLTNNSGVFSYSLPYGPWNLTAILPDGAIGTSYVTVGSSTATAPAITVLDNCGGTKTVQFKVQTQNTLLSWLLNTVLGATITGARQATSTCSTPIATTTFSTDVLSGLLNGSIAYGSWSFTSPTSSGTAGASSVIGSGTNNVTLTANYSTCPSGPVQVTLNTSTTTNPTTLVGYTGTVTATPGSSTCGGTTQQLAMVNGAVSTSLPYGDWTFAAGPSSTTATINSAGQLAVPLPAVSYNCSVSRTVTIPFSDLSSLLGSYTVRATLKNGCTGTSPKDTTFTSLLGLIGQGSVSLKPGTYDFTLTSPGNRTIDTSSSDQVLSVIVTNNMSVKIVVK